MLRMAGCWRHPRLRGVLRSTQRHGHCKVPIQGDGWVAKPRRQHHFGGGGVVDVRLPEHECRRQHRPSPRPRPLRASRILPNQPMVGPLVCWDGRRGCGGRGTRHVVVPHRRGDGFFGLRDALQALPHPARFPQHVLQRFDGTRRHGQHGCGQKRGGLDDGPLGRPLCRTRRTCG